MESGSDIGDITLLRQYEQVPVQTLLVFCNNKLLKHQNRKWRNGAMLAGVDGLKRLYDSRLSVLCGARGLGIALIDRIPFLKVYTPLLSCWPDLTFFQNYRKRFCR